MNYDPRWSIHRFGIGQTSVTCTLFMIVCLACGCRGEAERPGSRKTTVKSSDALPAVKPEVAVAVPKKSGEADVPKVAQTAFRFRDVTHDWGIKFQRFDDMRGQSRVQEVTGGGAALFDYDGDGHLDLYFTQGNHLPRGTETAEYRNELFRNSGDGKMSRVSDLARLTGFAFQTGCGVADIDADGFPDLYICAYGKSAMWHNNGDGTFENITADSGTEVNNYSTSVAFADFNRDGWVDLYVGTYLKVNDNPQYLCKDQHNPARYTQCSPGIFAGWDDALLLNDGEGHFIDVTHDAGITSPEGKGLAVVATDVNNDGWLDVYVANDGAPCFLYMNETSGADPKLIGENGVVLPRFQDRGVEFAAALNGEGRATSAMGIAHGDYDRDGWIDLLITNFYLETNTLYRNLQGNGFIDWSAASRLGPPSRNTLAFGTEFVDVDHDGWLDLIVTTGHIEDRSFTLTERYRMQPHLFRNDRNGRFTDVAATAGPYFESEWVGRSLAVGDMDRDGDLDIVMAQQIDPSVLLLNETPAKNSGVIIKPIGREKSVRDGIGVRVVAVGVTPILMRDVAGGGSFQSAHAQELHLGLGDQAEFENLDLIWPDGQVDHWKNVKPGYYVAIQGGRQYRIGQ